MITTIQLFDKDKNPISDKLIEINDKRLICDCDQIDLLPRGAIIDSDNFDIKVDSKVKDKYIVNKKNLKRIRFASGLGCCGPCGETMNVFDKFDRMIGYEFGDCYMSHCVIIPKDCVIANVEQQNNSFSLFALTEYNKKQKIVERIVGLDYDKAKRILEIEVKKRLKWEICNPVIEKELENKTTYYELKDIANKLDKFKNIDKFWLFTKYDNIIGF